jgi:hypothetical protein
LFFWEGYFVPGRDGTSCQNPVPSRGKILSLSRCFFVPQDKKILSCWKPYHTLLLNSFRTVII